MDRVEEMAHTTAAIGPAKAAAKGSSAKFVAFGLIGAAILGGGAWYLLGRGKETTDDAQVEGHVQPVAARVVGQVAAVTVKDNQLVQAGDILVELDKSDLEARVAAARADVAAAEAAVASAQAQLSLTEKNAEATIKQARGGLTQASSGAASSQAMVAQAKADQAAAESRHHLAQTEYDRTKSLADSGAISRAELDVRRSSLDEARAQLEQARARLLSAQAGIDSGVGGIELARGRLAAAETAPQQIENAQAAVKVAEARRGQAQAALRLAELNLSYATIRAPSAGLVARRTVEVGQLVSPERPLLAIVPVDDVWVVANFKEDQVAHMRPGQLARIHIDAYDRTFGGHIDSLSAGTGSRFALLPPDNASGNFVKVVQRVPVLVRLDQPAEVQLRPGMSASVSVTTGEP